MIEAIVGVLGMAMIGVIGWIVALGSRVSVLESQREDLPELLDAKLETTNVKIDEANRRLDRIERGMNGRAGQ
jgi:hypothetical protein